MTTLGRLSTPPFSRRSCEAGQSVSLSGGSPTGVLREGVPEAG